MKRVCLCVFLVDGSGSGTARQLVWTARPPVHAAAIVLAETEPQPEMTSGSDLGVRLEYSAPSHAMDFGLFADLLTREEGLSGSF